MDKVACVCVRVSLITLGFRAESFNWAWSKSHLERSTSTSPRKLFLPKVSWCHTERMSVWVRRYSMRTRYCNDSEPGDFALRLSAARRSLTNGAWERVTAAAERAEVTYSEDLVKRRAQRLLFHRRFSLPQVGFVGKQVAFHVSWKRKHQTDCPVFQH